MAALDTTSAMRVREFRRADLAAVAALWLRSFRGRQGAAPEVLEAYFADIFFDGPWRDEQLPSLICEQGARVVGFLGVLPRGMTFRGRAIRVAVATQLMADERLPYAAALLMRRYLAGPQDLSLSDGANSAAERLWQAGGGELALLYSLAWTRVLRPAGYALRRLGRGRPARRIAAAALRPLAGLADAALARRRRAAAPAAPRLVVEREPADETLLWCIRHLSGDRALQPAYQLDELRWLLRKAADKQMHGRLRKAVVRDAAGGILGWYLYHVRARGSAEVLQFGGRRAAICGLLQQLFDDAREQGALAVGGALEPRFAGELARLRCAVGWSGCHVLLHSRQRELLDAIGRGDAFLSRLEGEWWARFSDPQWSAGDAAAGAPAGAPLGAGAAPARRRALQGSP